MVIGGIEECLVFLEEDGKKKFGADGPGSEKKALLFHGAEKLYGPEVRDMLKFIIYGPFPDIAERMLQSFRAQGREGGLTLTPEAWEYLAKDKFIRESGSGKREVSNN